MTNDEMKAAQAKIFRPDGSVDSEALTALSRQLRAELEDKDFEKAIELWLAGWKSEPLRDGLPIMSWYWRRPPFGKRKHGRLFLSTDQAINHLRREKHQ